MKILTNLVNLLTRSERKKASLLLLMIFIMALLDMIGIASILPFMAVLTNPEVVETSFVLNTMFQKVEIFGIFTIDSFLFGLGVIVFILLVASLAFKAITMYWQNRFVQMRNFSVSKRLLEGYLHQPYKWFLNRHSADLGKNILSEVGVVVSSGIKPMLDLIAQSLVTFAILALLIFVDPILTVVVSLTLGISYGVIYKILRNYINQIGEERLLANKERFTVVSEVLGAVKAVKVSGLENEYVSRFIQPAQTFARHIASAAVLIILPRYALEAIAFGGMLLIILYLMSVSGDFNSIIPIAALYAFAGYRLMPALQQIYGAISQLRFVGPSLDALNNDLKGLSNNYTNHNQEIFNFKKTINLKNVNFSYPNTSEKVLKNINLTIPALSTIGLVGATGSGKTTIVDIILGLLEPVEGKLEIDNIEINKFNKRSWQNIIGYVPQNIYLADDTVAANIAFGVEPKKINQVKIEKAAKIANLHNFIVNELPNKYQTEVGERGVRLSGGQCQRIGIARALYHSPQVLILDEATSALDNLTEQSVMEAVQNIRKDITIIIIAHRISTVKKCDNIIFLKNGELKSQGTFEELIKTNKDFESMANSS